MIAAGELELQRRLTLGFLLADAQQIILQRPVRTSDGAGGTVVSSTISLPPQTFRLLPSEDGATARTTAEGETATPEYMLLGRWDADLERFDEFQIGGRRFQVVFITENRQYESKGEVTYLG